MQRQPDGEAQIDLKLAQYRKMESGPVEEVPFFDHPSGYVRIHAAMLLKTRTRESSRKKTVGSEAIGNHSGGVISLMRP
jgi:STE24 endopeptidase